MSILGNTEIFQTLIAACFLILASVLETRWSSVFQCKILSQISRSPT
jgi:hypothetical protein